MIIFFFLVFTVFFFSIDIDFFFLFVHQLLSLLTSIPGFVDVKILRFRLESNTCNILFTTLFASQFRY